MGRKKIIIEMKGERDQIKFYKKRQKGIAKKARELAILCDTDVLLLTFSPKGKPDLVLGEKSNFMGVIERYSNQSGEERIKRKMESLEALKKSFKSDKDHHVDVARLMHHRDPRIAPADKELQKFIFTEQIRAARSNLGVLRFVEQISEIDDVDTLNKMEEILNYFIVDNRNKQSNYMKEVSGLRYCPSQEAMNRLPLNAQGIPNSYMLPRKLSVFDRQTRGTTPATTKLGSPAYASNMYPPIFEGDQKMSRQSMSSITTHLNHPAYASSMPSQMFERNQQMPPRSMSPAINQQNCLPYLTSMCPMFKGNQQMPPPSMLPTTAQPNHPTYASSMSSRLYQGNEQMSQRGTNSMSPSTMHLNCPIYAKYKPSQMFEGKQQMSPQSLDTINSHLTCPTNPHTKSPQIFGVNQQKPQSLPASTTLLNCPRNSNQVLPEQFDGDMEEVLQRDVAASFPSVAMPEKDEEQDYFKFMESMDVLDTCEI